MYGRKGPKVCNMNVLSEPVVVTGRAMAFAALEIVLNKFILQIRERNKDLKQCLARESTGQDEYVDAEENCIMSCEPDGDTSTHETHTQSAEDYQPRGIHALISVLGHKAQLSAKISLLDLENCFLHERIQSRQLVLHVNQLQERTGRTIHELEHDPTVVGSMKHSGLVNISERLLKTSTNEEQKQYFLRWNDSLRQTITDLDQCESNGFKWQNFDLWAKRFELQVKLHSYETLSDTLRNTIHLPFVVMENKYLTEVANGRILTLKVQWLKERML